MDTGPEPRFADRPLAVVALGASAGGLAAFRAFFEAMPPESGMAFVLISHLDPSHGSLLPELVQKVTTMEVSQVRERTAVRPNQVYVIPPNYHLKISEGVLRLEQPSASQSVRLPIDSFFRSLAEDQGSRAVAIVLSGTGTDGMVGARAVKGAAGLVLAQTPESADFDGMPRAVMAEGLADFVLPPERMPSKLFSFAAGTSGAGREVPESRGPRAFRAILAYLRARTGRDFSEYKAATVMRRIERRMRVHDIPELEEYAAFLKGNSREARLLFKELLIGVTSFFRDPEAFEALAGKTFDSLLGGKKPGENIRVWVPGCSTGEEAYSIAILLAEFLESTDSSAEVQIFGTDLDEEAIARARGGRFPVNIESDTGPERLRRFFKPRKDGGVEVVKSIRDMLVFAAQDLVHDPPFSGLDLISCRNVLIYLNPSLQKRVLNLFHYSLRPGGVLFLGSAETIGSDHPLFKEVDRTWKVFRKEPGEPGKHRVPTFPIRSSSSRIHPPMEIPELAPTDGVPIAGLAEEILRASDQPPCVVVDDDYQVVFVHGNIGPFLTLPAGPPDLSLPNLTRHGLKRASIAALRQAGEKKTTVVTEDLRVRGDAGPIRLSLSVRPIPDRGPLRDHYIVSFLVNEEAGGHGEEGTSDRTAEELEAELNMTVQDLQAALEEVEISNEELQSTNEELQSANEELQSTNEELETSKEELQSLHEEAETVNAELQARVEELAAANDDLKNLLDSTRIATIFLDIDLCVRRFTSTATSIIPFTESDSGRPIGDLANRLEDVDLSQRARTVLDSLVPEDSVVEDLEGQEYLMRVSPYRTLANVIDGVVITFQQR